MQKLIVGVAYANAHVSEYNGRRYQSGYRGFIFSELGREVFDCDHSHRAEPAAYACAERELRRRLKNAR